MSLFRVPKRIMPASRRVICLSAATRTKIVRTAGCGAKLTKHGELESEKPMLFSTAVDTTIGLMMVYLLLSLICTSINEAIAGLTRLRARNLYHELSRALGDERIRNAFWQTNLIRSLSRRGLDDPGPNIVRGRAIGAKEAPSYLERHDFAVALIDALGKVGSSDGPDRPARPIAMAFERIDKDSPLLQIFQSLGLDLNSSIEEAKTELGRWFDQVMARASGVYKRWMSLLSFAVALILASALNADSLEIARMLWYDETLRAAVAQYFEGLSRGSPSLPSIAQVDKALPLPLGWPESQPFGSTVGQYLSKCLGLVLTAFAVTLGAPFWFDLLSRFVAVRNSGRPEGPRHNAPPQKR
ncbi:hypothetical protein GH983_23845 (plasmid) [Agrobacterium sp. MA01]|uniref:hypothetical protein n=1 Tax=Agrobacterium sp. MA01 TaxID=2664893 RepID=UPI00129AA8C5|nr:hypothetical protein [Agrobacterium sp. MA01]QGG93548.1 hypothetical protein GH983_23845 [Agrobacterium sp. MA01]